MATPPPVRPYPRSAPFAAWPAADREAWARAVAPAACCWLDAVAPAAHWSARRRANALCDAGRFVAWLAASGVARAEAAGLAARTTPERLAGFAGAERARGLRLNSIATAVGNVVGVARSLDPGRDWRPCFAVLDRIQAHARRLRPGPRHLVHGAELYALGIGLMEGALDAAGAVADPEAWRDGLMVALLAAAPMRVANFAALRIGGHVRRRAGAWAIELAAGETKTRRGAAWPMPERLAPYLEHHLEAVRPVLLARGRGGAEDTGALWLGAYGQPLGHQGACGRASRRARRRRSGSRCRRTASATAPPPRLPSSTRSGRATPPPCSATPARAPPGGTTSSRAATSPSPSCRGLSTRGAQRRRKIHIANGRCRINATRTPM